MDPKVKVIGKINIETHGSTDPSYSETEWARCVDAWFQEIHSSSVPGDQIFFQTWIIQIVYIRNVTSEQK